MSAERNSEQRYLTRCIIIIISVSIIVINVIIIILIIVVSMLFALVIVVFPTFLASSPHRFHRRRFRSQYHQHCLRNCYCYRRSHSRRCCHSCYRRGLSIVIVFVIDVVVVVVGAVFGCEIVRMVNGSA